MRPRVIRAANSFALLLAVMLAGACSAGPSQQPPVARAEAEPRAPSSHVDSPPAIQRASGAREETVSAVRAVSIAEAGDEPVAEQPAVLWVATHTDAHLWDGPGGDAVQIVRLPVGSFFNVTGEGIESRLPVHYSGNATSRASDGWVDLAAIGPIPPPTADWVQPSFAPRRVVTGLRNEVVRGDPSVLQIALTFDAGADRGASVQLLEILRDRGVRATFFVTGQFADRYPDIMQRIAADGHELANHSYTHPDFARLTEAQMRSEIRRGTESLEATSGDRIARLWRPPFGSRNERILQIVEEEGFRSIYWTFDSGDWLPNATTERIVATDLQRAVPGAIVVHHVQPRATAEAMPTVIDTLRARGYELVTVGEMLGP